MSSGVCLVTGATGSVGPTLVRALTDAGHMVRGFSRGDAQSGLFPQGVMAFHGDIRDGDALSKAMEGVEVVHHLAALLHIVNPPLKLRDEYERVNVGGTRAVMDAALRMGVRRVVFFSTIAVYGYSRCQALTEDMPPSADTFYAQTKASAEECVLATKTRDGCPMGVVLRLSAVYGPRVKGNYCKLLCALARRRFIPLGDGANRRMLIYDEDVANAALLAASHPCAVGRIYNVGDERAYSLKEIIESMCEALGRPPPRVSLPVWPVRLAAGMMEDVTNLMGMRSPVVRATVDKYLEDIRVDTRRIREELGFSPRFSLKEGWKETVREMRRLGAL